MGVGPGSEVILACEDGELRAHTRDQALLKIQARLSQLVPPGVSVVDEFLAEKREEAKRELEDLDRD